MILIPSKVADHTGLEGDLMEGETADDLIAHEAVDSGDTIRLARMHLDIFHRRLFLEDRWNQRHPVYARMLYWPLFGMRLLRRRQRYVTRMLN